MGGGLSRVDRRLLQFARKSPLEIEELTGVPAGEAVQRISVLLGDGDWLSDRQQERLLLVELDDLKAQILERLSDVEGGEFAQVASVALRALREIGVRLDSRRKLVDEDLLRITEGQARVFGEAFDVALRYVVSVLGEGSDEVWVQSVVEEGLRRAVVQLEGRVDS